MEKSTQELEAEVIVLRNRLEISERRNKSLMEGLYNYANVNAKWDSGKAARKAIRNANDPKYKPINSVIAQIFKDKKIKWLAPEEEMDGFQDYINSNDGDGPIGGR